MTTRSSHERRRLQVRLSVLAGSAVTLAVSWLGIAYADGLNAAAADSPVTLVSEQPLGVAPELAPTTPAGSTLVPAPQPTRQVVIVRPSRAS